MIAEHMRVLEQYFDLFCFKWKCTLFLTDRAGNLISPHQSHATLQGESDSLVVEQNRFSMAEHYVGELAEAIDNRLAPLFYVSNRRLIMGPLYLGEETYVCWVGHFLPSMAFKEAVEILLSSIQNYLANLSTSVRTLPAHIGRERLQLLSKRELEVLGYLLENKANKEIAQSLFISENTVKNHVANLLKKLQTTRKELVQ